METSCPVLSFSHTPPLLRQYPSPRTEEVEAALVRQMVRQMYLCEPMEKLDLRLWSVHLHLLGWEQQQLMYLR
jgi:hypothetical protein